MNAEEKFLEQVNTIFRRALTPDEVEFLFRVSRVCRIAFNDAMMIVIALKLQATTSVHQIGAAAIRGEEAARQLAENARNQHWTRLLPSPLVITVIAASYTGSLFLFGHISGRSVGYNEGFAVGSAASQTAAG